MSVMKKTRKRIYGSVFPDEYEWIHKKINEGRFFNISHMIQEGIRLLRENEG